jgi:DNA-binding transcriptional LysR family regulator
VKTSDAAGGARGVALRMELRRLRYFIAVAEELHFTRAAARLGIRQPPLSAQIRQLEKEMGTLLFERGTRGVELTDAGKLLLKEARDIVGRADRAALLVQRRARGESGEMVVGFAGGTYLVPLIPTIMRSYRDRYADVILHGRQSHTAALIDALREGEVDVAFVRPPVPNPEEFRFEPIIDEEIVAVLPHGHRLAKAKSVALSALAKETFTLPPRALGPGLYDRVIAACEKAGFCPQIGQEASTLVALPSMVAAGFGVSVVPRSLTQICVDHVAYRPLAGTSPRAPIALAYRRASCPAAVRNLVAVARNCVRSYTGPGWPVLPLRRGAAGRLS